MEWDCRSKCCNAKVKVEGMSDFLGSTKVCTVSFSCSRCGKPCDVVKPKDRAQKIQEKEKKLDPRDELLQELVKFLDGINIHPIKGVILSAKKKRQLIKLQKMEQKLSKAKKS